MKQSEAIQVVNKPISIRIWVSAFLYNFQVEKEDHMNRKVKFD